MAKKLILGMILACLAQTSAPNFFVDFTCSKLSSYAVWKKTK